MLVQCSPVGLSPLLGWGGITGCESVTARERRHGGGFCVERILDFRGDEPVLDDDFAINKGLWKYENVSVCAESYRSFVAVAEKDLRFA